MHTALTAINFFNKQTELSGQYRENKLQTRMKQLHAQCNKKLQDLYTAYQRVRGWVRGSGSGRRAAP